MRCSHLLALLAPLFARGSSQTTENDDHSAAPPAVESGNRSVTFEVPCEADDEAFLFTFKLANRIPLSTPCVETQITLNDQPLVQEWAVKGPGLTGFGDTDVSSKSTVNDQNHQLDLAIKSDCDPQSGAGPNPITDPYADNGRVLQSTVIRINRIDGKVPKSNTNFTLVLNASTASIIKVVTPSQDHVSKQTSSKPLSVPSKDVAANIDHENQRLQILESELHKLKQNFDDQKAYVEQLHRERTLHKCPIQAIVDTAKGCAHKLLQKITPSRKVSSGHDACDRDHSRQFSMLASLKGEKKCSDVTVSYVKADAIVKTKETSKDGIDSEYGRHGAVSDHQNSTRSSGLLAGGLEKRPHLHDEEQTRQKFNLDSQKHSHDTPEYLLLALGILTTIFCLGCVSVKLHHRCCNPRAQAERLARREERRTRRQYKCLARKQAWRQWWDRHLFRNTEASTTDYEEKRALIMAQKGILESAMQDEINRLRSAHGYSPVHASAAEEGRVVTESLPPYRSRAGSGRPPSYTSDSNDMRSVAVVTSVTSGIAGDAGDMSPVRDFTPDSSVMSLSPRHSSETLRTERSVV